MTKKITKNITLDSLAGMISRGFDDTEKRFDDTGKRFDRIEKALKDFKEENSLENEEIKLRLNQVAYRFELEEVDRRLRRVEAKLATK
ncbi:MAG: hypothetical protein Q7S60_02590 [bacterium]|nr:hypothetical protein [bacterium]